MLGHADVITGWQYRSEQRVRETLFSSGSDLAKKARVIDPKLALAYSTLMLSQLIQNRKDEALGFAKEGMKMCPSDPYSLRSMSIACNAIGNFDEAIACIDKAIELDPLDPSNYLCLINCNYSNGDFVGVVSVYEREFSDALMDDLPPHDWSLILSSYSKTGCEDRVGDIQKIMGRNLPEFGTRNLKLTGAILPERVTDDLIDSVKVYLPQS